MRRLSPDSLSSIFLIGENSSRNVSCSSRRDHSPARSLPDDNDSFISTPPLDLSRVLQISSEDEYFESISQSARAENVSQMMHDGISPNISIYGDSPLHICSQNSDVDAVVILLAAGADVNIKGVGAYTPLHHAAQNGSAIIVSKLLSAGAITDCKTSQGLTPLHLAARYGHDKVLGLLVEAGLDINIKGPKQETALHVASRFCQKMCVSKLMDMGASLSQTNSIGDTPLTVATSAGVRDIIEQYQKNRFRKSRFNNSSRYGFPDSTAVKRISDLSIISPPNVVGLTSEEKKNIEMDVMFDSKENNCVESKDFNIVYSLKDTLPITSDNASSYNLLSISGDMSGDRINIVDSMLTSDLSSNSHVDVSHRLDISRRKRRELAMSLSIDQKLDEQGVSISNNSNVNRKEGLLFDFENVGLSDNIETEVMAHSNLNPVDVGQPRVDDKGKVLKTPELIELAAYHDQYLLKERKKFESTHRSVKMGDSTKHTLDSSVNPSTVVSHSSPQKLNSNSNIVTKPNVNESDASNSSSVLKIRHTLSEWSPTSSYSELGLSVNNHTDSQMMDVRLRSSDVRSWLFSIIFCNSDIDKNFVTAVTSCSPDNVVGLNERLMDLIYIRRDSGLGTAGLLQEIMTSENGVMNAAVFKNHRVIGPLLELRACMHSCPDVGHDLVSIMDVANLNQKIINDFHKLKNLEISVAESFDPTFISDRNSFRCNLLDMVRSASTLCKTFLNDYGDNHLRYIAIKSLLKRLGEKSIPEIDKVGKNYGSGLAELDRFAENFLPDIIKASERTNRAVRLAHEAAQNEITLMNRCLKELKHAVSHLVSDASLFASEYYRRSIVHDNLSNSEISDKKMAMDTAQIWQEQLNLLEEMISFTSRSKSINKDIDRLEQELDDIRLEHNELEVQMLRHRRRISDSTSAFSDEDKIKVQNRFQCQHQLLLQKTDEIAKLWMERDFLGRSGFPELLCFNNNMNNDDCVNPNVISSDLNNSLSNMLQNECTKLPIQWKMDDFSVVRELDNRCSVTQRKGFSDVSYLLRCFSVKSWNEIVRFRRILCILLKAIHQGLPKILGVVVDVPHNRIYLVLPFMGDTTMRQWCDSMWDRNERSTSNNKFMLNAFSSLQQTVEYIRQYHSIGTVRLNLRLEDVLIPFNFESVPSGSPLLLEFVVDHQCDYCN